MKIHDTGDTLTISNIRELAAGNAEAFRDEVRAALGSDPKAIEIDLSDTDFVDSCGLGALISLYKFANNGSENVPVRLLNPTPSVQQLFELTRLHRVFEIVRTEPHVAAH
jgi:anti-sigma B factor antagonist